MSSETDNYIRLKTKELVEQYDLKISTIGNIIKSPTQTDNHKQQTVTRGKRFLEGDAKITTDQLVQLAAFFKKSIDYFFPPELDTQVLCQEKETDDLTIPAEILVIEESLRSLGFDEAFIKTEIRQLMDSEAYKKGDAPKNKNA